MVLSTNDRFTVHNIPDNKNSHAKNLDTLAFSIRIFIFLFAQRVKVILIELIFPRKCSQREFVN